MALAAALTLFTVLTVVAPTFELVAVSRFFAGLPHGAFFGMGALIAADMLVATGAWAFSLVKKSLKGEEVKFPL